jgi:hypothetical protein
VVLSEYDPRAWEGTLAFGARCPSREEVRAHVDKCKARGWWSGSIPVQWFFGAGKERIWWEHAAADESAIYGLKPYHADLRNYVRRQGEALEAAAEARRCWRARQVVRAAHALRAERARWRTGRVLLAA